MAPSVEESDEGWALVDGRRAASRNRIKDIYQNIRWCWVLFALTSVVLQATRTVNDDATRQAILNNGELVLTIVFDVEIIIRVLAELPDWRRFFYKGRNVFDLVLAIGSSIIQIPVIHQSTVYPWLTCFQLARFYRVILEIPRMKPLLVSIFNCGLYSLLITEHLTIASGLRKHVRSRQHDAFPRRDQYAGGARCSSVIAR